MTRQRQRLLAYVFVTAVFLFVAYRGEQTRDADQRHDREARAALITQERRARLDNQRRDRRIRERGRREICKFIDAEHNRERERLIEGERQIRGPFRELFPNLTDEQLARIHAQNRKRYNEVFETRPKFCPPRSKISPYPSLEELG